MENPGFSSNHKMKENETKTEHKNKLLNPTTDVPKFKFLHNIIYINSNFFPKTLHTFFLKPLSVTLPTDVKKPNWKTSFCFTKTFKASQSYSHSERKKKIKNRCCKVNRYFPSQPNLLIRKFIWEVVALYSIICSLWFKELATSTSHITAPSMRLTLKHQIPEKFKLSTIWCFP